MAKCISFKMEETPDLLPQQPHLLLLLEQEAGQKGHEVAGLVFGLRTLLEGSGLRLEELQSLDAKPQGEREGCKLALLPGVTFHA